MSDPNGPDTASLDRPREEPTVPARLYSAALDEVYALRMALAYEAGVVEAHADYKTFPKTRRPIVENQAERMRASARGEVLAAYASKNPRGLRAALRDAGAPETLTRQHWEAQHGL